MNEKLITIAKFDDYIQADLAKQVLEDYGIKSVVTGQNAANTYSGLTAIAGPSLEVMESFAEKAKQILKDSEQHEGSGDQDDDIEGRDEDFGEQEE